MEPKWCNLILQQSTNLSIYIYRYTYITCIRYLPPSDKTVYPKLCIQEEQTRFFFQSWYCSLWERDAQKIKWNCLIWINNYFHDNFQSNCCKLVILPLTSSLFYPSMNQNRGVARVSVWGVKNYFCSDSHETKAKWVTLVKQAWIIY